MCRYQVLFVVDGKRRRVSIDAESEFAARHAVMLWENVSADAIKQVREIE